MSINRMSPRTNSSGKMSFNTIAISAFLAVASVSAFFISERPMTHNEAKMYCAGGHSRLLDVYTGNIEDVKEQLAGQKAWIGSWDYNYYNDACMSFHNGHIGEENCETRRLAACNNPSAVLKSTREEGEAPVLQPVNELTEEIVEEIFSRDARARQAAIEAAEKLPPCADDESTSEQAEKVEI